MGDQSGAPPGFGGVPGPGAKRPDISREELYGSVELPPPSELRAQRTPRSHRMGWWVLAGFAILAVIAVVTVLSGGAQTTDETPEETVQSLFDTVEATDADGFCDLMSKKGLREATQFGGSCKSSIGFSFDITLVMGRPDLVVTGSSVDGDRAEVYATTNDRAFLITLVQTEDGWRINEAYDGYFNEFSVSGSYPGFEPTPHNCAVEAAYLRSLNDDFEERTGYRAYDTERLVNESVLQEPPPLAAVTPDGGVTGIGACA